MKLKPAQRRAIKHSLAMALNNHRESIRSGLHEIAALELVRVSRMIANLNGAKWPE